MKKAVFNSKNPEAPEFSTEKLSIIVLGGVKLGGLVKLRDTLKIETEEKANAPIRQNLDLYHSSQVHKLTEQIAGLFSLKGWQARTLHRIHPRNIRDVNERIREMAHEPVRDFEQTQNRDSNPLRNRKSQSDQMAQSPQAHGAYPRTLRTGWNRRRRNQQAFALAGDEFKENGAPITRRQFSSQRDWKNVSPTNLSRSLATRRCPRNDFPQRKCPVLF